MTSGGLQRAMILIGFEARGTGGGCMAYWRRMSNGDDISICTEDSQLPTDVGERVWLSRMRDGQILYEEQEPSVLHAIGRWANWSDAEKL